MNSWNDGYNYWCIGHDCTNYDIRLVDGRTVDDGRVEYCFHSEWSPFCQMHDEEASVACKQLGYTDYTSK